MGNFFSSLIGGYAQTALARKEQKEKEKSTQVAQRLEILKSAMSNPSFKWDDPATTNAVLSQVDELTGGGKKGSDGTTRLRGIIDKLRGKVEPNPGLQQPLAVSAGTFHTPQEMQQQALTQYQQQQDVLTQEEIKRDAARAEATEKQKPLKMGSTSRDGKVYNIWRYPDGHEEQIEDVAATDKDRAADSKLKVDNATISLRNAQRDFDKAKGDPNSPAFKLAFDRLQLAKQTANMAQQRLALSDASYQLRWDIANRPAAATRARADQANIMQGQIDHTEDQIETLGSQIGPLVGRKNLLDVKIGDVDPQVRGLKTNLDQIASMMSILDGYRGSAQLRDQFKQTVGELSNNPDALLDSLEEIRRTTQLVIDTATKGQGITAPEQPLSRPTQSAPKKVGDTVTYQGKQYRIKAIRPDGKYVLGE